MTENELTRAGFVAIIGEPNVGKSTLLNAILGTHLSIVTNKPQTTRKSVLGIHTDNNNQLVFLDTPGLLDPKYELQKSMMEYVRESIDGADVILVLLDVSKRMPDVNKLPARLTAVLEGIDTPVVVGLNKVDKVYHKKELLPVMASFLDSGFAKQVVPLSALQSDNTEALVNVLVSFLPEHPFFYDPEMLSEHPERFFISEYIREAVFREYKQEIPYSTEVMIVEFNEHESGKWHISADIIVERDTQKAILIGKGGESLKKTGMRARQTIEDHLGEQVFLELYVKVRGDWRNNKTLLTSFGY